MVFHLKNNYLQAIFLPVAAVLLLFLYTPIGFCTADLPDAHTLENEMDFAQLNENIKQIISDLEQQEIEAIKTNNNILWSIPAAFSEDEFDTQVHNLHINVPLYGEVPLNSGWYTRYKEMLDEIKKAFNLDQIEQEEKEFQELTAKFYQEKQTQNLQKFSEQFAQNDHATSKIFPGLDSFKKYLNGRYIPGVGLYRSDITELGFIAANLASEYLLFKDIKQIKLTKVKDFLTLHCDVVIELLEKVSQAKGRKKTVAALTQKLTTLMTKHCALFHYNPFKKELAMPFIKYLLIQRILNPLKSDGVSYVLGGLDNSYGFVRNSKNELVRSAVTPLSVVTLAKVAIAPMQMLSQSSQQMVSSMVQGLQLNDKLFSYIKFPDSCYAAHEQKTGLPIFFYAQLSGVIGELLVLVMATKIIDNLLQQHMIDSMVANPQKLLKLLKENKKLLAIENPTQQEYEEIMAFNQKFEKSIERALTLDKKGVSSWLNAKMATYGKIATAGFVCFVLPSLLVNGIPLLIQFIKVCGDLLW